MREGVYAVERLWLPGLEEYHNRVVPLCRECVAEYVIDHEVAGWIDLISDGDDRCVFCDEIVV